MPIWLIVVEIRSGYCFPIAMLPFYPAFSHFVQRILKSIGQRNERKHSSCVWELETDRDAAVSRINFRKHHYRSKYCGGNINVIARTVQQDQRATAISSIRLWYAISRKFSSVGSPCDRVQGNCHWLNMKQRPTPSNVLCFIICEYHRITLEYHRIKSNLPFFIFLDTYQSESC